MRNIPTHLLIGVITSLAFCPAHAYPVTIANSGFETDNVADNGVISAVPASWTWAPLLATGGAAASYVQDKAFLGGSPHNAGIAGPKSGDQYWLGHAVTATPFTFSIIHQDTPLAWSSLSAGDTLTVSMWATYRSDYPGSPYVGMWLNLPDGTGIDAATKGPGWFNVSASAGGTVQGQWTPLVWNYQVTQADINAASANSWGTVNVGIGFADPSGGSQIAFDDVSLDHVSVSNDPPAIASVEPADNSTNIPVASNLVANFNKPIALTGSGSITLKNLSGGADIPIALPGNVSISGAVLTINQATNLVASQEYAVEISADAITDIGTPAQTYAGLLSSSTPNWTFTASPAGPHVKVFLLGGQSNAVGLGLNSGLPVSPVNLQQPQPDVLFYSNYPAPGLTTLRPGSGGSSAHFGPELTFGRAIADASPGVTYAIIKHAVGATALWDDWNPATGATYSDFRTTVTAGLAALQAAGYTTEIVGMVWHQGESDALEGYQAAYQINLTNFIADIRSRYGANLRFLIGEIGNKYTPALAALNTVIAAQQAVAASDRNAPFIPAKDLTFQDDLHFDTHGMITLGQRFAAAYASRIPRLSNAGFENPVQPANGYELGDGSGTGSLVGSVWSFGTQPSGITKNGSSFGPPAAPEGTQAGILRGIDSIATAVEGFEANVTYRLTLSAAGRTGTPNNFQVYLGGTPVTFGGAATLSPPAGSYSAYISDYITGSGPLQSLELRGMLAGDTTAFIDNLSFSIFADAPTEENPITLQNRAASNIGSTTATLGAFLITPTVNADVTVHWGTSNGGTNPAAWTHSAAVGEWSNQGAIDISHSATGLTPNTPYWFTFRATNATEDVWAAPSLTLTTLAPTTADNLLTALVALKNHVNNSAPLSAAQVTAHTNTIIASKGFFDANANIITAAKDLIQAYDTRYGALFVKNSTKAGGFSRTALTIDEHWAVYNVMQGIMDDVYNNDNLVAFATLLANYKFNSSSDFPGACAPPANPNNVHTAKIGANFTDTAGWAVFDWTLPSPKPTGTYLAPGTYAYVTVPSALVNNGYKIRVGAHRWDMSTRPPVKRLERSILEYAITSTTVKIASPLGGGIYILVPLGADDGVVDVQIQGAVRSPFFSSKSFHTTTSSQWTTEKSHPAPWADFQSDKYMMQVPRSWMNNMLYTDVVNIMADWDAAQNYCNDLMGFPRVRGKESMYSQVDVIIRSGAYAPGYPMANDTYDPKATYNGNQNTYLLRGPKSGGFSDVQFHEQGHGYLFPKFAGETESAVHLPYFATLIGFGLPVDEAFRKSLIEGEHSTFQTVDTAAINWMTLFKFSAPPTAMTSDLKQYQLRGHAKFADMVKLFGISTLNDTFKSYVDDYENGIARGDYNNAGDELIFRLSRSAGADLRPLLKFWGIYPVNNTTLGTRLATANIPKSKAVYDRLLNYRSIVPADNAAFQTYCQGWWKKVPVYTGYEAESNHARQYNSTSYWQTLGDSYRGTDPAQADGEIYNAATRTRIQTVIDGVMTAYFPNGDPSLQNQAPRFTSDPITGANATENASYSGSLASNAADPENNPLTFSKLSGPTWLSVAANGTLSGTPAVSNVGLNTFSVQVSDGSLTHTASLRITVVNVNDAPTWNVNPIIGAAANANSAYSGTLAGAATDVDAGTSLTYAKLSGPAWLVVAGNGALSGTPGTVDQGDNVFTVSVSDGIAAPVVATLNITVGLPVDHFAISTIPSPQMVGVAITGITLTAKDATNATATGFTGTVTFGGTGGFSGTSGTFTAGVLTGFSVTPTVAGTNLTLTVSDGASPTPHTGTATINTIVPTTILLADNFTTANGSGLTAVNANLAARQSGSLATQSYANYFGSTEGISANQLTVGSNTGFFNTANYLSTLTTGPTNFTLSFDTKYTGTTNNWISPFLTTHEFAGDDRGGSEFGLLIFQNGSVVAYGGSGSAQTNTAANTALVPGWNVANMNNYSLVATATTANTGTYDVSINGVNVLSGVAYHLGTTGATVTTGNTGLFFAIRNISGGSGTFDNLQIKTVASGPGPVDHFAEWAGGAGFDADTNNDGIAAGMAWLLGAANPSAAAAGLLPKAANESGKLVLSFSCLKSANRGTAVLKLEYSRDLGLTDAWTLHQAAVPGDAGGTVNGVVFTTSANSNPDFINMQAEIPATAASPGTHVFCRLTATQN